MNRLFGSLVTIYTASKSCETLSDEKVYRQYSESVRDYLGNYYNNGVPYWVLPVNQRSDGINNCQSKLNSALVNYRLARIDFQEYFPDAPSPPKLEILEFREFKRKPGRSLNIVKR